MSTKNVWIAALGFFVLSWLLLGLSGLTKSNLLMTASIISFFITFLWPFSLLYKAGEEFYELIRKGGFPAPDLFGNDFPSEKLEKDENPGKEK